MKTPPALESTVNGVLGLLGLRLIDLRRGEGVDSRTGLNLLYPYAAQLRNRLDRDLVVVQMGANDGESEDAVRSLLNFEGIRAVLVEPHPFASVHLTELHASRPHVAIAQVAISDEEGIEPFYVGRLPGEELRLSRVSSFRRSHVEDFCTAYNERNGGERAYLEEIQVNCCTPLGLLQAHGLASIDVLVIDTEGFDYRILNAVFADDIKVGMIQFEYHNMSRREFRKLSDTLQERGYLFSRSGLDVFAVHESVYEEHFDEHLIAST